MRTQRDRYSPYTLKISLFCSRFRRLMKKTMSSSTKENHLHDHFKPCKSLLVFPTLKASDFVSLVVKAVLVFCTVASISFVLFVAINRHSKFLPCPECDRVILSDHRKFDRDNISGSRKYLDGNNHEKTNISHILFGIGGSATTWHNRRLYNELWWKPNVTRGFVWLDEKPPADETWPETSPPYRVSADTSKFKYTCSWGSRSAVRITRIVKESLQLRLENIRWFVMGDDDTVFFPENLVTVLSKYDHGQMYYIGGNSESVEQDMIHSYTMAYGGGGFAISYPLAVELVKILDGCIDRYASFYGSDQKIQACISEIGVPLTKEPGFHQVDIRGNPYGLLAAHPVAPLVSLHHLDYVQSIFPGKNKIDALKKFFTAYEKDPGRIVQHSFCHDLTRNWSVSVSWGYTVQLYPSLVTSKKLETAFLTFQSWRNWATEPFTFNTRPYSHDPCDRPILYFLDRVEVVGPGRSLTTYKMFKESDGKHCEREDYRLPSAVLQFNVSTSTLSPDSWKLAPRRQCCEINSSGKGAQSVVQVNIRGCKSSESVTIPP